MIPEWLKKSIKEKSNVIINYQNNLDDEMINLLPFCP